MIMDSYAMYVGHCQQKLSVRWIGRPMQSQKVLPQIVHAIMKEVSFQPTLVLEGTGSLAMQLVQLIHV